MVYLITGKAGAGKTTYMRRLEQELIDEGRKVFCIDGDEFRKQTGNSDYSDEGRLRNLMKAAELASKKECEGMIVLMAFVSPYRSWRNEMRRLFIRSRVIYIPGGTLWERTTYERPDETEV